jgi:hypothetical protein
MTAWCPASTKFTATATALEAAPLEAVDRASIAKAIDSILAEAGSGQSPWEPGIREALVAFHYDYALARFDMVQGWIDRLRGIRPLLP